jgi:catechol 2,3-dioxygenase-like lactoylglutathione lyase family enzyme
VKMHLNLATRDLDRSVAFYSTLLSAKPAKQLSDYALFITENPGLELALDLDPDAQAGHGHHFGIVVDSAEAVDAQIQRLQSSGYAVGIERARRGMTRTRHAAGRKPRSLPVRRAAPDVARRATRSLARCRVLAPG